jgi:N-acetylmuramoyl-L-alanine amidase
MRAPLISVFALPVMAMCAATARPALDLQVTAVRFWTAGDVTRVAIEANGDFTFRRDRLNNPDRLFFDIVDARPNVGGARFSTRQVNDKLLRQIRIAETQPGRTRVVLDLNAGVDYSVSKLENPNRLMIELRPEGKKKDDALPVPSPTTSAVPVTPPSPPVVSTEAKAAPPPDAATTILTKATPPPAPLDEPAPAALKQPAPVISVPVTSVASKPLEIPAVAARKATSDGSRSLIRALGLKVNRVVIDAGHGGHDVGTTGVTGLLEKDLVLDVALRLGKLIEQRLGAEVIYTRQDDTYVPLEERTAIANRNHADLFLSIHANSSPIKAVAGVETFYLNFTSSGEALDVAARENASSHKTVFELRDLIQSISLHDKIEESKEFASNVHRSMQANAVRSISTAKDRGIKRAPFVVLIGAQMPSVLSEIGFLSNPKEENLLKRGDHRQQVAEALFKGLARYSETLSHIQVADAK